MKARVKPKRRRDRAKAKALEYMIASVLMQALKEATSSKQFYDAMMDAMLFGVGWRRS